MNNNFEFNIKQLELHSYICISNFEHKNETLLLKKLQEILEIKNDNLIKLTEEYILNDDFNNFFLENSNSNSNFNEILKKWNNLNDKTKYKELKKYKCYYININFYDIINKVKDKVLSKNIKKHDIKNIDISRFSILINKLKKNKIEDEIYHNSLGFSQENFNKRLKLDNYILKKKSIFKNFIENTFNKENELYKELLPSFNWNENKKLYDVYSLRRHQKLVCNYLNDNSPYRGLLLYHGLGSGKTACSIGISEGFQKKEIIVMTPASLSTNFKDEIKTFGKNCYKKKFNWTKLNFKIKNENVDGTRVFVVDENLKKYLEYLKNHLKLNNQIIENFLKRLKNYKKNKKIIIGSNKNEHIFFEDHTYDVVFYCPNFIKKQENFEENEENAIEFTIKTCMDVKYKFVHYNAYQFLLNNCLKHHKKYFQLFENEEIKKMFHKIILNKENESDKTQSNLDKLEKYQNLLQNPTLIKKHDLIKKNLNIYIRYFLSKILRDKEIFKSIKNLEIEGEGSKKESINPFDNKLIIIDEIHNFINSVLNIKDKKPFTKIIYDFLLSAKNLNLVFLSATPVTNKNYEMITILNLLNGYEKAYKFNFKSKALIKNNYFKIFQKYENRCIKDKQNNIILFFDKQNEISKFFKNHETLEANDLKNRVEDKNIPENLFRKNSYQYEYSLFPEFNLDFKNKFENKNYTIEDVSRIIKNKLTKYSDENEKLQNNGLIQGTNKLFLNFQPEGNNEVINRSYGLVSRFAEIIDNKKYIINTKEINVINTKEINVNIFPKVFGHDSKILKKYYTKNDNQFFVSDILFNKNIKKEILNKVYGEKYSHPIYCEFSHYQAIGYINKRIPEIEREKRAQKNNRLDDNNKEKIASFKTASRLICNFIKPIIDETEMEVSLTNLNNWFLSFNFNVITEVESNIDLQNDKIFKSNKRKLKKIKNTINLAFGVLDKVSITDDPETNVYNLIDTDFLNLNDINIKKIINLCLDNLIKLDYNNFLNFYKITDEGDPLLININYLASEYELDEIKFKKEITTKVAELEIVPKINKIIIFLKKYSDSCTNKYELITAINASIEELQNKKDYFKNYQEKYEEIKQYITSPVALTASSTAVSTPLDTKKKYIYENILTEYKDITKSITNEQLKKIAKIKELKVYLKENKKYFVDKCSDSLLCYTLLENKKNQKNSYKWGNQKNHIDNHGIDSTTKSNFWLNELSSKTLKIVRNVKKSLGLSLIYSQFKSFQGTQFISRALEAEGYEEFNAILKKNKKNNKYEIDEIIESTIDIDSLCRLKLDKFFWITSRCTDIIFEIKIKLEINKIKFVIENEEEYEDNLIVEKGYTYRFIDKNEKIKMKEVKINNSMEIIFEIIETKEKRKKNIKIYEQNILLKKEIDNDDKELKNFFNLKYDLEFKNKLTKNFYYYNFEKKRKFKHYINKYEEIINNKGNKILIEEIKLLKKFLNRKRKFLFGNLKKEIENQKRELNDDWIKEITLSKKHNISGIAEIDDFINKKLLINIGRNLDNINTYEFTKEQAFRAKYSFWSGDIAKKSHRETIKDYFINTDDKLKINEDEYNVNEITKIITNDGTVNLDGKIITYKDYFKNIKNIKSITVNNKKIIDIVHIDSDAEGTITKKDNIRYVNSNKYGKDICVYMITKAGAEGISLKNIRQVHINEPYWNRSLTEQVLGRSRRINSHITLHPLQQNVRFYEYFCIFKEDYDFTELKLNEKEEIWKHFYSLEELGDKKNYNENELNKQFKTVITDFLQNKQEKLTTDLQLQIISIKKKFKNENLLKVIKSAALDCKINFNINKINDKFINDFEETEELQAIECSDKLKTKHIDFLKHHYSYQISQDYFNNNFKMMKLTYIEISEILFGNDCYFYIIKDKNKDTNEYKFYKLSDYYGLFKKKEEVLLGHYTSEPNLKNYTKLNYKFSHDELLVELFLHKIIKGKMMSNKRPTHNFMYKKNIKDFKDDFNEEDITFYSIFKYKNIIDRNCQDELNKIFLEEQLKEIKYITNYNYTNIYNSIPFELSNYDNNIEDSNQDLFKKPTTIQVLSKKIEEGNSLFNSIIRATATNNLELINLKIKSLDKREKIIDNYDKKLKFKYTKNIPVNNIRYQGHIFFEGYNSYIKEMKQDIHFDDDGSWGDLFEIYLLYKLENWQYNIYVWHGNQNKEINHKKWPLRFVKNADNSKNIHLLRRKCSNIIRINERKEYYKTNTTTNNIYRYEKNSYNGLHHFFKNDKIIRTLSDYKIDYLVIKSTEELNDIIINKLPKISFNENSILFTDNRTIRNNNNHRDIELYIYKDIYIIENIQKNIIKNYDFVKDYKLNENYLLQCMYEKDKPKKFRDFYDNECQMAKEVFNKDTNFIDNLILIRNIKLIKKKIYKENLSFKFKEYIYNEYTYIDINEENNRSIVKFNFDERPAATKEQN